MNIGDAHRVGHARRLMTAAVCVGASLPLAAGRRWRPRCRPATRPRPTAQRRARAVDTDSGQKNDRPTIAVAVTLTETSIDGMPDDLVAGLIDVTVTDEAGRELNFAR